MVVIWLFRYLNINFTTGSWNRKFMKVVYVVVIVIIVINIMVTIIIKFIHIIPYSFIIKIP